MKLLGPAVVGNATPILMLSLLLGTQPWIITETQSHVASFQGTNAKADSILDPPLGNLKAKGRVEKNQNSGSSRISLSDKLSRCDLMYSYWRHPVSLHSKPMGFSLFIWSGRWKGNGRDIKELRNPPISPLFHPQSRG